MALREKVQDLYSKVYGGRLLDAFDQYYGDDVVMQEVGQEPRVGKPANRAYEEQFVGGLTAVHSGVVKALAVDETGPDSGTALIESDMHFDHAAFGPDVRLEQVSVQQWKDGKIVRETFYHA